MSRAPSIRKPESLLDPTIARRYFAAHCEELFGRKNLRVKKVTPWVLRARHLVVFFDIIAGEPETWKRAVGLADKGIERLHEHERLEALVHEGRSKKHFTTPKPLFVDPRIGMSFITHVPGDTLADVARNRRTINAPTLRNVARWLKHLQSIPPKNIPHVAPHPKLHWTKLDVKQMRKVTPEFAPSVERAWSRWEKRWKREAPKLKMVLAHGDFHPVNIKQLPNTNDIVVLDFGLLCKAPKFWDLASFLTQVDAIHGRYLKPAEVKTIREGMLAAWETEMGRLSPTDREQLAWLEQFFRIGTVAYLFARDPYPHIKRLLNTIT